MGFEWRVTTAKSWFKTILLVWRINGTGDQLAVGRTVGYGDHDCDFWLVCDNGFAAIAVFFIL